MKECVKRCLGEIIVSCQAYEDTPFYGSDNIKRFVESAMMGGAKVVRCCWPNDIKAARSLSDDLIIVGINKTNKTEGGHLQDIFITPTFESAKEVIEAGADIVAFDVRITENRSKEDLLSLLSQVSESYPEVGIMADCATMEDARICVESGKVDILATTLSGMVNKDPGPDVGLLVEFKKSFDLPVNAEGRVWELADLKLLADGKADMITIGTAITRPHLIAKRFIDYYKQIRD